MFLQFSQFPWATETSDSLWFSLVLTKSKQLTRNTTETHTGNQKGAWTKEEQVDQNCVESTVAEQTVETWAITCSSWEGNIQKVIPRSCPCSLQIHQVSALAFYMKSPAFPTQAKESSFKQHWKLTRPRSVKYFPLRLFFLSILPSYFCSSCFQWFILCCHKVIYNYINREEKHNI